MIPKIIHQIWSGVDEPLPEHFYILGETWKENHPTWRYELWDNAKMNQFVQEFYPEYWSIYCRFPYNVQRWDAIRYLILDKIGGLYVDFDYECIKPLDDLFEGKTCCFALEPQTHCEIFDKRIMFNNALMACEPGHPFMKEIIRNVLSVKSLSCELKTKDACVLMTTGPWVLIDLYEALPLEARKQIYLIPDRFVTPFDVPQARKFRLGIQNEELDNCLNFAYAVHYFYNGWMADCN